MKIAFYTDYPPFKGKGGAEIRMQKITTMLADRGHEVHVFCGGSEREEKIVEDVHYHIYKNYWENLPWGIRNMVYVLQNWLRFLTWGDRISGFDIVDAYRPLWGADVATFTGISINALFSGSIPKRLLVIPLIMLNSIFVRTVDKFIVTYEKRRKILKKFHNVEADVVYAGIDSKFLKVERNPRDNDKFFALSTKGIGKVCKIAEVLDRKDVVFWAVNPSEPKKNLPENVRDLGEVSHEKVFNLMKKSDVFLQLSPYLSLAEREAMAVGLPVIACESELITDGESGFLVKNGDPESIAEKINLLTENSELRKKISKKGQALVKDFTWENTVEKTLSKYRK